VKLRTAAALSPVAASLALGGLAARVALRHPPRGIASDLAQPLVVVSAWHGFGAALFAMLGGSIALAALALVAALYRLRRSAEPGGAWTIVFAAAFALAAAHFWPVVFSSDVYAYAAYGDLVLHGLDPYRAVPSGFHDAFADAARGQWSGSFPVCVYGPGFVALAALAVAAGASHGLGATLLLLRLSAALAFLASAAALHAALDDLSPGPRFAATCAYALNPVALWSVAEGHNDALMMFCVLGGAALARRGRTAWGGLALGLSALIKAPGILLGTALALDARAAPGPARARFALALGAGATAAASLALPFQLPALAAVGAHGRYAPGLSLPSLIGLAPALAVASGFAILGAGRLWNGNRDGYPYLALGLWLAIPNPYPWYVLWVLPSVSAALGSVVATALWGVTILSVLRYLPDAAGNMTVDSRLLGAAALAPLVIVLAGRLRPASNAGKAEN
jgi:hypothetical protein